MCLEACDDLMRILYAVEERKWEGRRGVRRGRPVVLFRFGRRSQGARTGEEGSSASGRRSARALCGRPLSPRCGGLQCWCKKGYLWFRSLVQGFLFDKCT